MIREINLLETSERAAPPEDVWLKRARRRSVVFLVVFVVIVLSVFFFTFFLRARAQALSDKISEKETEISGMKDREGLHQIVKMKIRGISKIMAGRSDLASILDFLETTTRFIEETAPSGITLSELGVPNLKQINLKGETVDPYVLETFFSALTEKELKKYFTSVTLNSLIRDEEKKYTFDLMLDLAPPAKL